MPNIGDKFIVIDDYDESLPNHAIKGDILEFVSDYNNFKNLTKNRGQETFGWGIGRLLPLTPFPEGQNANYLGIDKTRKFVVIDAGHSNFGDVLTLLRDDGTECPEFQRSTDSFNMYLYWYRLAYLPKELDEEPKKEIPKYIQCHTQQQARLVLEKIERDSDLRWYNGKLPTDTGKYLLTIPKLAISTHGGYLAYMSLDDFIDTGDEFMSVKAKDYLYPLYTVPSQLIEPLSKTEKDYFAGFNQPTKLDASVITVSEIDASEAKFNFNYSFNKPKKTFMNNIIDFAKSLSLSPDEKALREAGFKNDKGQWTKNAFIVTRDLEAVRLGYKDFDEMVESYESAGYTISCFEKIKMFSEYAPKLLEIAYKKIAEDKKCKK